MEIVLDMDFFSGLEDECQAAAMETMELLRQDVVNAQVMPRDGGDLQNNLTHVEKLPGWVGARLITDGPYARRLYYHPEYNFQTVNNPNAQGRWLDHWLPGGQHESFAADTYADALARRLPK